MESSMSNLMLTMKVLLVSIGAICSAIAIKSSVPLILYEFPTIWNGLISWLKPPYLYVLLNGIIIIIAATSRSQRKEQQHSGERSEPLISDGTPPVDELPEVFASSTLQHSGEQSELLISAGTDPVPELVDQLPEVFASSTLQNSGEQSRPLISAGKPTVPEPVDEPPEVFVSSTLQHSGDKSEPLVSAEIPSVPENLVSISRSPLPDVETELLQQLATEKPLVSSRFSHRKPLMRTSHEGVKSLRVARVKRHETLESTWKKITEGRHVPLTRHLNKLDTWQNQNRGSESPVQSLKKVLEPSPSQDELNRRVEAFIKKFNEEMRLQREQSLKQYMEMINRGV